MYCRNKTLQTNALLTLDPNVSGVFNGPYPFGIDPVSKCTQTLQLEIKRLIHGFSPTCSCFPPSDMELGSEPTVLPQLLQDENVSRHRGHPHELWGGAECLQPLVSDSGPRFQFMGVH